MKTAIFILWFLFCFNYSFSQGNLQFNRVINIEFSRVLFALNSADTTLTVPANKVWKIESAASGYSIDTTVLNTATAYRSAITAIYLNGALIFNPQNASLHYNPFPIYLSSGATYRLGIKNYGPNEASSDYLLSKAFITILEFNVVP